MTEKWIAFIEWCKKNPYSTIERLEIVGGEPNLIVIRKQFTETARANVKICYNTEQKMFTKQQR